MLAAGTVLVRVPLGVVGIIYESRPNVTVDAGALCLMSGNASILRGGAEAAESSRALHACVVEGLLALAIFALCRSVLGRLGVLGRIWHPALFEVCLFLSIVSLLVLLR